MIDATERRRQESMMCKVCKKGIDKIEEKQTIRRTRRRKKRGRRRRRKKKNDDNR